MFTHLGIPKNKMKLLRFRDYYNLAKTKDNLIIILFNDYQMKYLINEYNSKRINFTRLYNGVRKHLDVYYGLRYGNAIRTYLREIIH